MSLKDIFGDKPLIMGILNVTPDSFSDGGEFFTTSSAIDHGIAMTEQGAHIIDVGGESTRPGAGYVDEQEEINRVIPVVEKLSSQGCVVSVDTQRPKVALLAVEAGAVIINDVSSSLGTVAADAGVGWIAMHMKGNPQIMQNNPHYQNVFEDISSFLVEKANSFLQQGGKEIWIDPGIGFGKNFEHNIELLARLDELKKTGFDVAVGLSRKTVTARFAQFSDSGNIADVKNLPPVNDRLDVSLATATWALINGVSLIRVHDVLPHVQAVKVVTENIVNV